MKRGLEVLPARVLEDSWESALKANQRVNVQIQATYPGSSLRPDTIIVKYQVDGGDIVQKIFKNRPGGK